MPSFQEVTQKKVKNILVNGLIGHVDGNINLQTLTSLDALIEQDYMSDGNSAKTWRQKGLQFRFVVI